MLKDFARVLAAALLLMAAACAQHAEAPPAPAASNELPPLENGVYVAHGLCVGAEFECHGPWRLTEPAEMHERVDPASPVIATLPVGEQIDPIGGQLRLAPRRGVVHTAIDIGDGLRLDVGDVVYMLGPEGEGTYGIWRHGEQFSSYWADGDDSEPITWDPEPLPLPANAITGEWTQVRRGNGQIGWVAGWKFECAIEWCGPPDRQ